MKDGLNIRGLTTAASIWAVSAIGVLLGVGFYAAALLLALLCTLSMSLLHRLEARLPGRATLDIALTFRRGFQPKLDELDRRAEARGYRVLRDSLTIVFADDQPLWSGPGPYRRRCWPRNSPPPRASQVSRSRRCATDSRR